MSRYFEDEDGYGQAAIWHEVEGQEHKPQPVLWRNNLRSEHEHLWPLIVWAVTTWAR